MFLEVIGKVTGIFVVVYDGQHGLKFTLGRVGGVVGPGVHFKIPIIQKYEIEETKHTTLDLEPQTIQLKDDLVYDVDCKLMYQIVNLRKAIIEIDNLVTGLENRVVMAVQHVVQAQDRESVRNTERMVAQVTDELRAVGDEWGVQILQFGFSNISPSPATLEITQLELLAEERFGLYTRFRAAGLAPESAVALLTGAVIATISTREEPTLAEQKAEQEAAYKTASEMLEEHGTAPVEELKTPESDEEDESEPKGDSKGEPEE
ncbi:MAG: regulator of protease activity HflC (stomatin/prohibitin superfamily) [Planctomycetota bacterium]|jgi:regulator of protease activity HflC (stomatin/prohibitin superfamily)